MIDALLGALAFASFIVLLLVRRVRFLTQRLHMRPPRGIHQLPPQVVQDNSRFRVIEVGHMARGTLHINAYGAVARQAFERLQPKPGCTLEFWDNATRRGVK